MSDWKIYIPEATTNLVLNPSAEAAGNYSTVGVGPPVIVRNTGQSLFGSYCYDVTTVLAADGIRFTTPTLANADHYFTFVQHTQVLAGGGLYVRVNLAGAQYTPVALLDLDGYWTLYGVLVNAVDCVGQTAIHIQQFGAGAGRYFFDRIQLEQKDHWTTYCDGDQAGCEWTGVAHGSTSRRMATSRAGGRVYDLQDDYNLDISGMFGVQAAPQSLFVDQYAILPGGELNNIKILPRPFSLTGVVRSDDMEDFHAEKQELLNAIKPNAYPKTARGFQPVRFRYDGAAVIKVIAAHYEGGLEGSIRALDPCYWENIAARFLADDPFWYAIGEESAVLSYAAAPTYRIIAGRRPEGDATDGMWDSLGPPAAGPPAVYNAIYAIAVGPDKQVYFGGQFTDFNNHVLIDYIGVYNIETGAFADVGAGVFALNGRVHGLAFAPNGDLYAVGVFTEALGNRDYIARWDGAAWNAVGNPTAGAAAINIIWDVIVADNGDVYVVGDFQNFANVANADYIARWDGAAWNAVGQGFNNIAHKVRQHPDGTIWAVGQFTQDGGGGVLRRIGYWDGAAWNEPGGGLNNVAYALDIDIAGDVYVGGIFTQNGPGTITLSAIARWNGQIFSQLGSGLAGGTCWAIAAAPDGDVLVAGAFTSAGGLTTADNIAKWNGASWGHFDVNLPGAATAYAITVGAIDPVVPANYDIWLGFTTTGAGADADYVTVDNEGTEEAFPRFVITRTGGTSAVLEQIRNETTGQELLFDYSLLDGETLIIDLTPTQKKITSNFFGAVPDAILPNSDFGTFSLLPGDNIVSCFINVAGAPTVTAFILWRKTYWSQD